MSNTFSQSGISINLSQYVSHVENGKPVISASLTAIVMTAGGHSVIKPETEAAALLSYMISEGVLKVLCDRTPNPTFEILARRFVADLQGAIDRHVRNTLQEVNHDKTKK